MDNVYKAAGYLWIKAGKDEVVVLEANVEDEDSVVCICGFLKEVCSEKVNEIKMRVPYNNRN